MFDRTFKAAGLFWFFIGSWLVLVRRQAAGFIGVEDARLGLLAVAPDVRYGRYVLGCALLFGKFPVVLALQAH